MVTLLIRVKSTGVRVRAGLNVAPLGQWVEHRLPGDVEVAQATLETCLNLVSDPKIELQFGREIEGGEIEWSQPVTSDMVEAALAASQAAQTNNEGGAGDPAAPADGLSPVKSEAGTEVSASGDLPEASHNTTPAANAGAEAPAQGSSETVSDTGAGAAKGEAPAPTVAGDTTMTAIETPAPAVVASQTASEQVSQAAPGPKAKKPGTHSKPSKAESEAKAYVAKDSNA